MAKGKYKSLKEIQEAKAIITVEEQIYLQKALESNDPQKQIEANSFLDLNFKKENEGKSYLYDPFMLYANLGYKDKPFKLTYDSLREMAKTPIISSIITTRKDQISYFSRAQDNLSKIGWTITKKRPRFLPENEFKLEKEDHYKIESLITFVEDCGEYAFDKTDFEDFLKQIVDDSLTLDQMCFEVIRNRKGKPIEFFPVDAATFRLIDSTKENINKKEKFLGYPPAYVQIYQNEVVNEYFPFELCFGIRNPVTDIRKNGYGISELENLIKVITWLLYSDAYNGKFFSQGAAPKGILKLKGNVNSASLEQFKQNWRSQVAGVGNAWKMPIIQADEMDYVDMQKNNTDMQFTNWQEYLIKLSCAGYKISPKEIGFDFGGGQGVNYNGNQEYEYKYSQEKGLKPLLNFIAKKINKYIIKPLDSQFEFQFTGVDLENEKEVLDGDILKINNFETLNEVRKRRGLESIKGGDIVLNGIFTQNNMQEKMAQQGMMGQNQESNEAVENDNKFIEDDNPMLKSLIDLQEKIFLEKGEK